MASGDDERKKAQQWLEGFHEASAKLDADYWLDNYFTEDVSLQYANNPVAEGSDVRQMFKAVFPQLDMMTHEITYFDVVGPRLYQAATIRYLVKGDDPAKDVIQVPAFGTFYLRGDGDGRRLCYKAEIFLDPSPVFKRIAEKFGTGN